MKWYWSKYPTWVKVLVIIGGIIGIGMALSDAFKGSQKVGSSSQAEQSVSNSNKARSQTPSNTLKVKGFYLGMNIDEAAEILNTKYITPEKIADGTFKPAPKTIMGEDGQIKDMKKFEKATVERMENGMFRIAINKESEGLNAFYSMATGGLIGGPQCMVSIKAENDKKVSGLYFDSNMTNFLFNSKDMDCKTFTEEFARAYDISNFEPFIKEEKTLQVDPYTNTTVEVPVYKHGYKCSSDNGYYIEISEEKNLLIKTIPKSEERGFN